MDLTKSARRLYKPSELQEKELIAYNMLMRARKRAKREGYACTIGLEDIIVPEACPITGEILVAHKGRFFHNSPTLDKIIPELGYIPGNVAVISFAANNMKSGYSFDDLRFYCLNMIEWIDDYHSLKAPRRN